MGSYEPGPSGLPWPVGRRAEPSVTGRAEHYLLGSDAAAPAASSLAPVAVRAHLGYVDTAIV